MAFETVARAILYPGWLFIVALMFPFAFALRVLGCPRTACNLKGGVWYLHPFRGGNG